MKHLSSDFKLTPTYCLLKLLYSGPKKLPSCMGMSISYDIKNPFKKTVFFFNGNVSRHFPLHVSIHCWAKEVDRVDYILNVGKPNKNPKDTWRSIPVSKW